VRRYETILILRPDLGEPAQKDVLSRYAGIITASGGDLAETEEWGYRELAYRIRGERRGFYVRLDYGGNGATMNEVERNLKISDDVLRYLSVLVDDNADMEKVRAEIDARHRRAAEARAVAEARAAAIAAERAAAAEAAAASAAEAAAAKAEAAAAKDEAAAKAEAAKAEAAKAETAAAKDEAAEETADASAAAAADVPDGEQSN
jgi:small subunit ribosomal protein S6